ncbi:MULTISPECIES: NAD(+) diphosphatase [Parabacteroides]|uniref:NAD(+) diphosphatase n=2 Tax=Parabacteroides goldsteinii TaxID=328812 RepID=A0A6G1ZBS3_9BACT|nr:MULTISPECIES: NAD(+) diphosphatase [Parabacteroides]EOS16783.1 NAD+ diphosphatase [Parabacteroides goldsteinii dnLKV18]KAI4359050.1 NADH pyrophosphatase [Parabacteroides sp. ASF519]MBF0766941.1 NAD(+) diphosphatase [Parabacteroides goldsteinii]MDZ3927824.1 NAD(+) diphosphatase [Parabacteroides goldsteinii]MRX92128.1 NAD(+) diphosphatase [Parabacteroides goldsteinii]
MSNVNNVYWFIFFNNQLLLQKKGETYTIPYSINPPVPVKNVLEVSLLEDMPACTASVDTPLEETAEYLPMGLRASYDYLDPILHKIAGKAYELIYWDQHSRFCPSCGTKTVMQTTISKQCPNCKYEIYPVVSPAILVLIRKGDAILLVHARNFRGSFYGLVAGFLETGETLEECVRREVMEETGLEINNITYFGNQPWPYPSNLMVGFIADYVSGTIRLQDEELSEGAFFTKDNLPELPRKLSLARKMIDWWLEQ